MLLDGHKDSKWLKLKLHIYQFLTFGRANYNLLYDVSVHKGPGSKIFGSLSKLYEYTDWTPMSLAYVPSSSAQILGLKLRISYDQQA